MVTSIVKANHMVTPKRAEKIMKYGVDENGEPLNAGEDPYHPDM